MIKQMMAAEELILEEVSSFFLDFSFFFRTK